MPAGGRGDAFQLVAGGLFNGLRAPIGAHVRKNLRRVGQKLAKQHAQAVEYVVLGSQHIGLARSGPVEGCIQQRFGEIAVGIEIRPLPLSLEPGRDGVVAEHFFLAVVGQVRVAAHQVFDDAHHFDDEGPILFLLLRRFLDCGGVFVQALLALFAGPGKRTLKFRVVINFFGHAADDFDLVHAFHAHAQIFFDKGGINNRSADAHADGTDLQIALAAHGGGGDGRAPKAQEFFLYVGGDFGIVGVLHIVAVNAESRQAFLCVRRQNAGQVDRAGALRAVEAPYALDGQGIHIHGLRAVAPARGHGQGDIHAGAPELIGAGGRFRNAADGRIRDDHLHRRSVRIPEILFKQSGR